MANLSYVLYRLLDFYQILIIVEVALSWFRIGRDGVVADIQAVLRRLVEPYLGIFRRFVPPMGGLDFSPVVALLALQLVERIIL
ncbi:protein of unknown function YGGT [Olsenella uli DSM 7084]|uniref:YggT family protein n=1 Tax=Olsenella uli (strain ATCC 49627 / DSM 7084 / CCUG 31166 / CIP 109912 / JCM 12494 / LMG 11480 / NCIMB 702895 / VPI D76D-27C) TaxID=633147 RepID=E1QVP6_OLSUV|nr:YggT family protein [Olsenella uli]ADK68199.1 protein of unknown function YGGT [Olsenella uli DSM 7084]EUB32738.1 YGGT family protein [Olsenella uli MSTE5]KRO13001.1 hypothetical protein IV77_GL000446 [Olsenella uli DSM 7084]MBS6417600.1 YggT family protein [Olsenella uli]